MQNVLVAGATGSLGYEVVKLLAQRNIPVRALDRNSDDALDIYPFTNDVVLTDASDPDNLKGVFHDIDVVFSAVGTSVSLFSKSGDFEKTDWQVNRNLVNAAKQQGVKRFVYISIKGADMGKTFLMADVHKRVEDLLRQSGMKHTVIRPVGFFSGFHDWLVMGKKGLVPIPGSGEHKTNPIHQADLAQVVVDNLFEGPQLLEAGGPNIYTRNEIARMVKEKTGAKTILVPEMLIEPGLFLIKMVDDQMQAKLDYFKFVSTNDMVATQFGTRSLRDYIRDLDLSTLPDVW
jgi:uncharacterized protein YbjT (DUF2867 family)